MWFKTLNLSKIYEDKLWVIIFNITLYLYLSGYAFTLWGLKIPPLDEYQRQLTEWLCKQAASCLDRFHFDDTMHMRSAAQRVHRSSSAWVLGLRIVTYGVSKVLSLHSATRNLIPRVLGDFPTQNNLATSNANFHLREYWQNPPIAIRG